MLSALRGLILTRLEEGRGVLVFPSQAAADAWALACLRERGGALDPERLIGWDRFKEGFLSERRRERPANRVTRSLWAALIVARQNEAPFLARILGPGRASQAFVGFLSSLPPSLAAVARGVDEAARRGRNLDREDPLIADLLLLHRDYAAFMESRSLFEPSWELPRPRPLEHPHLLIAPELVEDWEEWRPLLEGLEGFSTAPLPPAPPSRPLLSYPSAWEEYREVFLRIAALLDRGVGAEEIGVTVADLKAARPWIEEAAERAGVPLAVRQGRDLASSPFGRLLSAIGEAVGSGFGLPAMKALLLDRFASWKQEEAAADLVRFGIEYHAFASWSRAGREVDVWEESFRVTGRGDLRSWYRQLRAALRRIVEAPSFKALGEGVSAFRGQFLEESGWSPEENRLVQRCMEELAALSRAEEDYARGLPLPSPFRLWLSTLAAANYVAQRRGAFVQVYPWRVSALLPFRYHFLLGCGFEAVSVGYGGASFLREDQLEALGRPGRDATEDFLRAYLLSGDLVQPCHATEEIGGWSAPHPFFGEGTRSAGEGGAAGQAGADELPEPAPDCFALEAAAWRAEGPLPSILHPRQLGAFAALARSGGPEAPEAFDPLPSDALARLLPRLEREGRLRMSYSLLAEYRACPFRWLLGRALRVEKEELELGFFDAFLAGEMAHRAIERLFEGMGRLGPIETSRAEEYRRLALEAPASILPEFARDRGPFLEPMFEAWAPLLGDRLLRLVEALLEAPGWETGELEAERELPLDPEAILLEGRIDRLARRGEELAIVDYKKKNLPKEGELLLAEEGGAELANTQLASYLLLAEAGGGRVGRASFWSIEEAKELLVLGEGGLRKAGDYGPELRAFRTLLGRAAEGIRGGRFAWAPPSSPACTGCEAKRVCRSHYSAGR